ELLYREGHHKITLLEPYLGCEGLWLTYKFCFEGLETEERLAHKDLREGRKGGKEGMSTTASQFFTNQNLFSTNYLENRLPETSLWQDHQAEAAQAFAAVKTAYKDIQGLKLGPGEEA